MKKLILNIIKNFLGYAFFLYLKYFEKKNIAFLFHDITNTPSNYSKENNIFLYKKTFSKIINHIEKNYKIINPKTLQNNIINKNYALITFDDGYKSFIKNAIPILYKKKIPCLIFLNGEVVSKNKENINAIINFFSKRKDFQIFMKKKNILKPYYLNVNIDIIRDFYKLKKFKANQYKNKIKYYQGKFLDFYDLKYLDKIPNIYFGNHLYNHWNLISLKEKQIINNFNLNKNFLKKFDSYVNFFAIPNGKVMKSYNDKVIRILKKCKPKKIFSSNNYVDKNFNSYEIDRVSLEKIDKNIYYIYFKILKSRLIKII